MPLGTSVGTPGEVVSEPWRLVAEAFPPPAWLTAARALDAGETPGPEDASAEPDAAVETPPVDSPADATRFLSRDEVEAALGLGPDAGPAARFELAEPGSGAEEDPALDEVAEELRTEYELAEAGTHLEPGPSSEPQEEAVAGERPREAADEAVGSEPIASPEGFPGAPEEAVLDAPDAEELPAAVSPEPADPEEEPPSEGTPEHLLDLDLAIRRFNQRHRVLYRAIRSEIGAGAANFIRSCRGGLGEEFDELFAESRLLPDGTWDADSLKRIAREKRVQEPWLGLERLLDREFEMLRPQIGEARGKALREQLIEVTR